METLTIYHNPRCSKSRAALALLQEKKVPLRVVEYLKEPLSFEELKKLQRLLGLSPREWVRKGEEEYKKAKLGPESSDDDILRAMAKYPILMERPIVVRGKRAVVGRPPEKVLELLG
ncbi:MAG: arsenate reductase [Candidatus Binatia bacterium]|nr:MAG: arsenate reductase [Candidatus Binatia bacterium]